MPLQPGDKLGPYEILSLIGKGGMGEVYRAHDARTGRDVAIKVSAEQFNERFDREVRAVAALNHPNICMLFDVGPNYLVMEFIEGESPQGPLPPEEALRVARQIAAALEEAHGKGIVHRDLKPANIRIKPDGNVKVLDFGLAKIADAPEALSENSPTLSMAATRAGVILGTAAYMSPEQARGKRVDKRADIWAFGVVFYEILTGDRLFGGDTIADTLIDVATKQPEWDRVPPHLLPLLRRCLEKDPNKRLRDIGDLDLLLAAAPPPPPPVETAPPSPPGKAKWISWGLAALATVLLATLAFFHFREVPPPEHILSYAVAPPEGGSVHSFAISPDGRSVVMAAAVSGKRQLWLRPMDALQWQPMPSTDDARYPFWSPDSRYIAFFAEGKLRKVAAAGGPSQPICDAADGRGGTWSRDDVIVFSPSPNTDTAIQRVPAAGGVPAAVIVPGTRHLFPAFLPDGRHFTYEIAGMSPEQNGIYFASLNGQENRRVLADVSSAVFAPSPGPRGGHLLFSRENNLMAQPFDPAGGQASGDVFPVAEGVSLANSNNYAPMSASGNGVLLYWTGGSGGVGGGNSQIVWYDRGGKVVETLSTGNVIQPVISPNEKSIAFSRSAGSNTRDIWLRDLARGTDRRLTTDASQNVSPFWSPKTGDRIVFRSTRGGHNGDLYLRASSGAGQDEVLLTTPNSKIVDQWSQDGQFIVYSEGDSKTKGNLWYLPMGDSATASANPADRKPVVFLHSPFDELQGQLSPDSRWMAYMSNVSGQREVYVQPFPAADNEVPISTAGGEQPRWRGDGKELFYLAADGKITSVPIATTAGPKPSLKAGAPMPLFDAHSVSGNNNAYFNYDVTADGKRFLVAASNAATTLTGATPPLTVRINWNMESKK